MKIPVWVSSGRVDNLNMQFWMDVAWDDGQWIAAISPGIPVVSKTRLRTCRKKTFVLTKERRPLSMYLFPSRSPIVGDLKELLPFITGISVGSPMICV